MTAGTSKRPLIAKLGIQPGDRIALIQTPEGYLDLLGELPAEAILSEAAIASLAPIASLAFLLCFPN
jgi:hypothetical protein